MRPEDLRLNMKVKAAANYEGIKRRPALEGEVRQPHGMPAGTLVTEKDTVCVSTSRHGVRYIPVTEVEPA